jgi:hypothetical protein
MRLSKETLNWSSFICGHPTLKFSALYLNHSLHIVNSTILNKNKYKKLFLKFVKSLCSQEGI